MCCDAIAALQRHLHHSTQDEDMPVAFWVRLAKQTRTARAIADRSSYEGDNHHISRHFRTALSCTIQFFDRILNNSGQFSYKRIGISNSVVQLEC